MGVRDSFIKGPSLYKDPFCKELSFLHQAFVELGVGQGFGGLDPLNPEARTGNWLRT